VLMRGVSAVGRLNTILVSIKVVVLLIFIAVGFSAIELTTGDLCASQPRWVIYGWAGVHAAPRQSGSSPTSF